MKCAYPAIPVIVIYHRSATCARLGFACRDCGGLGSAGIRKPCVTCAGLGWFGIDPKSETTCDPGTPGRLAMLQVRWASGVPLFNPLDFVTREPVFEKGRNDVNRSYATA